ncbi:MAG: alcohol dehydrogenase catalytic domain-containing protein [Clostridiales Family XIII bacterium]|jgi:(R,R)-butanediol dehydrogenase/meso-butanediol dehydrogenase/diacetyl reductase/L-iditol 2-dehydrogenase|nr:alcohol dehydrogenase catalytic domain-containing protein [Clostridiales Family XIII bacterium]
MKVVSAVKVGNMKDPDPGRRGKVAVLDRPCPPLGDEDIKVKVAYCAICGSDPHVVGGIFGWEPPFGLGHEISGVVAELGPKATRRGFKVGDRVGGNFRRYCGTCYYCRNGQEQFCENVSEEPGMAEYLIWHESQLVKLPDDVSLKKGCLLEPVSIGVRVMDKTGMLIGRRVAVSGAGPIGLINLQLIKMFGATSLTMIEPNPQRRELARKFGADFLIDPSSQDVEREGMGITGGLGYDLVIEASGAPKAAEAAIKVMANAGRLLYMAMYPNDYEMPLNLYAHCYKKEIEITGSFVAPYAFPRAAQIMSRMDLDDFTDTVYDIDDPEGAFEAHLGGRHSKVIIRCNKDLD